MLYTAEGGHAQTTPQNPESLASLISLVFQIESWSCGVTWLNSGLEGMTYFGLGSKP